jgi:hypothetical protein
MSGRAMPRRSPWFGDGRTAAMIGESGKNPAMADLARFLG